MANVSIYLALLLAPLGGCAGRPTTLVETALPLGAGARGVQVAKPSIRVSPPTVIEGDPVQVVVSGLRPGQTVTLRASRSWSAYPTGSENYEATASFVADQRGFVDLQSTAPNKGSSYDRADPSALFWSMVKTRQNSGVRGDHLGAGEVRIVAEEAGTVLTSASARILPAASDVVVRNIREAGVIGVFARNSSSGAQPAVVVLGGSEGGLFTARWAAPILASHGYSVLGLGYFQGDEPSLSDLPINLEHIPLEVLSRARAWLAQQPGVDASRIALVGVSKGAELALVGAVTFPWVTAVAAFAPTHVVWEGIPPSSNPNRAASSSWTFHGRPLPYVRWSRSAEERGSVIRAATGSSRLAEAHWESLVEFAGDVERARIQIESSTAAVFVAAGIDDGLWPAAFSAEELRRRLARRGGDSSSVFEIHPTGHQVLGSGWGPTTQFQRLTGRLQGGNARLDAEAQRVIWPAFLKFLDRNLGRETK